MNTKLLNKIIIGIPTYNREDKCLKILSELIQIDGLLDIAEIIVVENLSKHGSSLENKFKCNNLLHKITYILNNKNIGLDGSILKLTEIAQEKNTLIWFLCDDDIIYPDNVVDFITKIQKSKSLVNFCKFDYQNDLIKTYKFPDLKLAKKVDYLRASFLPTVVINPSSLNVMSFRHLIGTNYIHIAIINSLINRYEDISIYDCSLGIQTANTIPTFNISETFIEGYLNCMKYNQLMDDKEIVKETTNRCIGYLSLVIKNIFNRHYIISYMEAYLIGKTIFINLGIISLCKAISRLFAIFILITFIKKT
jgi:hypothetical protein